ncbi:MAG: 1-acyl-sn-glycerol-3-phosphate acyltransferase, partial [Paludibacteraceae bacterium]|nr:1-acyl-sn-glycerol-3-phosphate acyltransferase [Paludibacteraceae bacterium]
ARLQPDSIREAMRRSKEVLLSGAGEYAEQYIAADPIGLYLPTIEKLRERGRVITFEDTPEKLQAMESAAAEIKAASPGAEITIFSPSEVARTNAGCIKRDSIIALTLSLIIIFILLISFFRSAKPLIYIAFSVLFGGLFSLAAIYLIKGTVSAIAVGAGSIILGIAIDYSLHFITHLKFNGSARETVQEVARPLTIGSFTTIAAFISLLFISAESMRDFGLFAALALIGTLIFVIVFMPYIVSDDKPDPATPRLFKLLTSRSIEGRGWVIIVTVVLTVILGIFSTRVRFDTNMQHLTYMTPEQRESLDAISAYSIDDVPERTAAWNSFWAEHSEAVNRAVREAAEAEGLDPLMFTPYGEMVESSIVERAMSNLNHDFNYVLWVCAIVVFTFLLLSMRSAEAAVISFLPMTVSWLWILGIMAIAGIEFNIVNIVLATFIFGLGDDYAIFMMDGLMQENTYGSRMLEVDKNAVTLSALTLFAGVVTLITATHPAMRSLASVTAIGMVSVVLVTFIVPPYVYRLLTEKDGRQRELPLTFSRFFISLYALLYYVIMAFIISVISIFMRKGTFHKLMHRVTRYSITLIPYAPFTLDNQSGESFEKPAIIVCNHQSMLDIMAIMALHPKIIILTNEWVWNNPFWSRIVRKSNFFPITLGYDGVLPHLREVVAQGYSVMVFPEGTRTISGEIGRFHPGAFRLAKDLGLDILPLMIHGFWHVLPKKESLLRRGPLYMEICERINLKSIAQEDDPSCLKIAKQFRSLYRTMYDNLRRER